MDIFGWLRPKAPATSGLVIEELSFVGTTQELAAHLQTLADEHGWVLETDQEKVQAFIERLSKLSHPQK